MDSLVRFFRKLWILVRREKFDSELEEEMAFHREHAEEQLQAEGLPPQDAQHAARKQFGSSMRLREQSQDMVSFRFESVLQDFRFAIRQLRKNPGFTATATLMLALGMCASVAIFAFVDAALLKPLPYRDPSSLVAVFERTSGFPHSNISYPDYLDWKKQNTVFSSLEAFQHTGMILTTSSGAQPTRGARVSDGFFHTLGVTPMLGRDFAPGEDLLSAPRTVLLSYATWQQRYGGKDDVLGQTVVLNGDANVIIGVLPPDFHFAPAEPSEFWTTIHASSECDLRRSCHSMYGVARLKDGVSLSTALANVTAIAEQLEKLYPGDNMGQSAAVVTLTESIVGDIRPILFVLLCGAGLLLLIASVNVASLLLVRSESRKREVAVRTALGASRIRLTRQFVTESLVLVLAGSALGLMSAYGTMQLLTRLIPEDMLARMTFLRGLGLTPRVWAFAGVISLLAAALFSLTPTLHFSLSQIRDNLAEGSRAHAGNAWRRVGSKLVVLELATAVVLLVGAGLLGKSLYLLLHVDIGMRPDHLATLWVAAPKSNYGKDPQAIALQRRVVSQMAALPGVKSVGITTDIPVSHWGDTTWLRILGRPWHGEHNDIPERDVNPEYFMTLGAKLLRGRDFAEGEDASKPHVAIINQAFAKEYFPGEDPIGRQLSHVSVAPDPIEIVGIVEDIKEGQLDTANRSTVYIPFEQSPSNYFNVVVRTSQAEQSLLPAMRAAIRQIDPDIVTPSGSSMLEVINDSQSAYMHRSSAWLVGGFAFLALLLGVVGLYGVVAYSVSQRTREIGIRMALGAQSRSVYQLVLKEAARLIAIGLAVGLVCSIAAATLMRTLLFSVRSWDVPTLAAVATVLAVSALLASYIPARRAASLDPVDTLRAE
jgi:macrolide transport system ATP-binding/permease protein